MKQKSPTRIRAPFAPFARSRAHPSTAFASRRNLIFFPSTARAPWTAHRSNRPSVRPSRPGLRRRDSRVERNVPKLPNPPRSPPPRSPPPRSPPAGLFLRCGGTYPLALGAAGAPALDDAGVAVAGAGVAAAGASGTLNGGKSPESSAQLDMFCSSSSSSRERRSRLVHREARASRGGAAGAPTSSVVPRAGARCRTRAPS